VIYLNSIQLTRFKGVSKLACDFDDFTVLAGLNNSGKTSVLQAVYLLFAALPRIAEHRHLDSGAPTQKTISLENALSPLGLRDTTWLLSRATPEVTGTITGRFSNGLQVELGIIRESTANFTFSVSHPEVWESPGNYAKYVKPIAAVTAAMLTPPGDVPSREEMVNGDQYMNFLREGKGAQLWRNGIWWAIQNDGFESFGPVQEQIAKYFPDVELLLPTLGSRGTPEILIKYKDRGLGPLDIAQSGAGLRTFISLARILEQSPAKVVLLDEPDSHLHASQQAVVLDLMLDAASATQRQVIIASHSPEIISRVPSECIRWIERDAPIAMGGNDVGRIMERLGVTAESYFPRETLPDILVYVEGVDDRPILEGLITWCRVNSTTALPTTLVVPHRNGRFEGPTLQGIARFARALKREVSVIGIRDLDWYYEEFPENTPDIHSGDGWKLLTLPCKELENLFCEVDTIVQAYERKLTPEVFREIIDGESNSKELVDEWCFQVRPKVRDRLPRSLDDSTRERIADERFQTWSANAETRRRLVSGKALLRKVRARVRQEHSLNLYPSRIFERLATLPTSLSAVATCIFDGLTIKPR